MSICQSGINCKVKIGIVPIEILENHPLMILVNLLPWKDLSSIVLPDLQRTGGKWWLGRKLKLRIHLGVFLLQQLYNKTDRQIEYAIKDNAAFQLFAGRNIVDKWHAPDHTKIEEFRSRLSPETQKKLANHIASKAVKLGFTDPSNIDIDSTVQEANMAYPSDCCLLKKLGLMSYKAADFLNKNVKKYIKDPIQMNVKRITSMARKYFFLPKNASKEIKDKALMAVLNTVCQEIKPVIQACEHLNDKTINGFSWNQALTIRQIKDMAAQYLKDVRSFILNGVVVPTKILSFHLKEVACFTKGKPGKKYQFGRAFQLCRLAGNFLIASKCTSCEMSDKTSLKSIIEEHRGVFTSSEINSVATDKGYYSKANEKYLHGQGVNEIGIQRPSNIKTPSPKPLSQSKEEELINRRAGIEPLIGHAKQKGQLGRSRMKSDMSIESSGYAAILGFNLRQLVQRKIEKMRDEAA